MMPSSHTLLSRWAPPNERGRMAVYLYSGKYNLLVILIKINKNCIK
jgi:hypothetical protein